MSAGAGLEIELGIIVKDGQPTLVNSQSFACEPVDTTGDGMCNAVGFDTTGDGVLNDIRQLPEGWKAMRDESGKMFFFHMPTGTSHEQSPVSDPTALQRMRMVSVSAPSPRLRRMSTYPGEAGSQIRFVRHRSCCDVFVRTMLENKFLTVLSVALWSGYPFAILRAVEAFEVFSWQNFSEAGQWRNSTADMIRREEGEVFDGLFFAACVIYLFLYVVTAGACPPCSLDKSRGGVCLSNGPHRYLTQPPATVADLAAYVTSARDSTPDCRIVLQLTCSHEAEADESETTIVSFQDTKVFPTTGCFDSTDSVDGLIREMDADNGHWYHIDFTYNFDLQTTVMQKEFEQAKAEYVAANEQRDTSCRATAELQGPRLRGPMLVAKDSPKLLARIFLNRFMLITCSYLGLLLPYLFIYNTLSVHVSFRCKKTFSC